MDKIPTLFIRNPENMKLVPHEVNPDAAWVLTANAMPTVKKDGTNILVVVERGTCIDVQKRRNPTREEKALGQEPGYVATSRNDPQDKHIFAAVDATDFSAWPDGSWSCEALGPKIQGGVESDKPCLYPFSWRPEWITEAIPLTYEGIKAYLEVNEIKGIVWHEQNGLRACKIKRRDFGLAWPVKRK
jgi:hypothetical protein